MYKSNMIIAASAFFALTLAGTAVCAQTTAPVPPPTSSGTQHHASHKHSEAEKTPACQNIVAECKKLGFIVGEWKKDNGLWKDCFDPVVKGGTPTRDGQPVNVPVSQADVQACQAAHANHKANHKKQQ